MTTRPTGPAHTPVAPRLTPAQKEMLRDCERRGEQITDRTYKPAVRLASLGFIEVVEKMPYTSMWTWRITAGGQAWLAAREGWDG